MIGMYDLVIAALSVIMSLGIVGVCLYTKCFSRYLILNLYILSGVVFTLATQYFLHTYGYTSVEYFYVYFTGDAIVTAVCYLTLASFFDQMFRQSIFHRYVRPTLAIFFILAVGVSGLALSRNVSNFYSVFVLEFQQNMYFVGVLLTFLLWLSMMYLGAETRRFALLVSGMGIYFTAHAASYAASFLSASLGTIALQIPPLAYNLRALVWLYTFLVVPEEEAAAEPARRRRWAAVRVPSPEKRNKVRTDVSPNH